MRLKFSAGSDFFYGCIFLKRQYVGDIDWPAVFNHFAYRNHAAPHQTYMRE